MPFYHIKENQNLCRGIYYLVVEEVVVAGFTAHHLQLPCTHPPPNKRGLDHFSIAEIENQKMKERLKAFG
jgi:hypothetical protein